MLSSRDIRKQFIEFFREKYDHTFVPSSPVVPHDDPTLLFTNAGMNQFKDVFLATGKRDYTRAVNSQKCIRAGGKHNDLEDVGKDTYHHTFFEMLGNWSFGDYFKKEAIQWAWELLTEVWGLEKNRLHATVFGGDEAQGLEPDDEAAELWKTLTDIDPSHVHYFDKTDNFWEMGDTGPCGPCSELHVDLTPDRSGASLVNADDPRVIEIWNLVFIQFNRDIDGKLSPLPSKHVDTGMGFERVTAVLQNKSSNYDTDVFTPLFDAIREVTGAKPYGGALEDPIDIAYRVIGDHIRCLTFALSDGAMPGNEGRGYVLRRILRRAVRHGRQTLGMEQAFLHRLVPRVVDVMGDAFPELKADPARVAQVIEEEEHSFGRTLNKGIALFDKAAGKAQRAKISGDDAFLLYDTFGFPLDLTVLMAEERGLTVDTPRFQERMEEAREISRAAGGSTSARQTLVEIVQREDLPETEFCGEKELSLETSDSWAVFVEGEDRFSTASKLETGQRGALVASQTPFYAEAGGQVGDSGKIFGEGDAIFRVEDTIRVGSAVFHLGEVTSGVFDTAGSGSPLTLTVDEERRRKIMANHTSTHVMNHKLRAVLGEHIQQKGSLVDEDKTRFDFSHNKALSLEELESLDVEVNKDIDADLAVHAAVADQEDALQIHGLRAVFGEKYPKKVRVVSIGVGVDDLLQNRGKEDWYGYSIEFCGGTHLASTGEARRFTIISEEAVAKGVRRVTGVTGERALQALRDADRLQEKVDGLKSKDPSGLGPEIVSLSEQVDTTTLPASAVVKLRDGLAKAQGLAKEHEKAKSKQASGEVVEVAREIAESAEGEVIVTALDGADAKLLRVAMDVIGKKCPDKALLLGSASGDKCAFVALVPKPLIERGLKAGDWVREVAKVAGGGGGGKPDMAQAGGKDPSKLQDALEAGRAFAQSKL